MYMDNNNDTKDIILNLKNKDIKTKNPPIKDIPIKDIPIKDISREEKLKMMDKMFMDLYKSVIEPYTKNINNGQILDDLNYRGCLNHQGYPKFLEFMRKNSRIYNSL